MAAVDLFTNSLVGVGNPADHVFAVTPHDTNELAFVTSYLYVGGAGNLAFKLAGSSATTTISAVPAGTVLPLRVKQVLSTGTTATVIYGMYPTPASPTAITAPLTKEGYTPVTTGTVSIAYTGATPNVHGGETPFVWTLYAGTLPTGITLSSSTGVLSGTPTLAGAFTGLTLRVTDNGGRVLTLPSFTLTIAP